MTFGATNNESTTQNVDLWLSLELPNGRIKNFPVFNATINPGNSFSKSKNFNISSRPLGAYTFTLNVGIYPGTIYSTNTQAYNKTSIVADKNVQSDELGPVVDPTAVNIEPNYPNPFNPSTNISYSIPDDRLVTLKVYNTLGEEVATLVNGFQTAGSYSAVWDGRNNFGQQVSSGIYIYRIVAGDFVQERKMILTK